MSEASKGHKPPPETLAKMRESSKRLWADPDYRDRVAAGIKMANANPDVKARRAAARIKLWADPVKSAAIIAARWPGRAEIPKWVPEDLKPDFIDTARRLGEEAAASHVRRLKAEAARP